MFLAIFFLTLFTLIFSAISTVPFSVGLLVLAFVISKNNWIFILALILGLFLDLISIRTLGYSSMILSIFTLILFLYEKKFETQTVIFVLFSTFLGTLIYLVRMFSFQQVLLLALLNSLITVIVFKLLWLKLAPPSQTI